MANNEKRTYFRKSLEHTYCLIDDLEPQFDVVDISAHGFSFTCDRGDDRFVVDGNLTDISILDSESQEIIHASGVIRHRSEFDARRDRVGVSVQSKQFDHTVNGRVRLPRRRPSIEIVAIVRYHDTYANGTVVDYNVRSARVALQQAVDLSPGEVVRISFGSGNRRLYDGAATVIRAQTDSPEIVVEFLDNLLELRSIALTEKAMYAHEIIDEKHRQLASLEAVSPEYKALVSEWRMYLEMVEDVLDREEAKGFLVAPDEARMYLEEILPSFSVHMRRFIAALNELAPAIDPGEIEPYKLLLKTRLEKFMRQSPLGSTVIDRMHGYLGDYETVKYFFGDPFVGATLFGKLINRFIMSLEPVAAHQHRIEYLQQEIVSRYEASQNGVRLLSLGSGPAEEILRLLDSRTEFEKPLYIALIDMDAHALADFYERSQFRKKPNVEINLVNFNIINILVGKTTDLKPNSFDMTYCAGMFDYFKDRFCRKFLDFIINLTAEGGNFYYTNVHSRNFARYFMDFAGGWEINHRDEQQTLKLAPSDYPCEVITDDTGTNVFVKGTKIAVNGPNGRMRPPEEGQAQVSSRKTLA